MAGSPQPVHRARPVVPASTPPPSAGGPGAPPAEPVRHAPGAPGCTGLPAAGPARPPARAGPGSTAAGTPTRRGHRGVAKGKQQRGRGRAGLHELQGGGPDRGLQAPRPQHHGTQAVPASRPHSTGVHSGGRHHAPVAAWPTRLLPHIPCRDAQPRQPAATHTPTAPLTAEQLYAVAAALLADSGVSFVHHRGPAQIAGSIQGLQHDAPHLWQATLRERTRVRNAGGRNPLLGHSKEKRC